VLERVGLTPYNGIQGQSLLPLMAGGTEKLRDYALIEEEGQRVMFGLKARVRMRTVLNQRYRLSLYDGTEWGELYDLQNDPMELENLWFSAKHITEKATLLQAMAETMIKHSETSPNPTAIA
jgi:hypothetical protein